MPSNTPDTSDTPAPQDKPFSAACERNRDPILAVLREHLPAAGTVLEIGCGTGQHAVHFARHLPHLTWQCSDQADWLPGARLWLAEAALSNTPEPLVLDVAAGPWPEARYEAIYSANTVHYMPWPTAEAWFARLPGLLQPGGRFVLYGPFNDDGAFTSEGNASLDAWLKTVNPAFGIRDRAVVQARLASQGLTLLADLAMPANNRCLVWRKAT
jgi:cyclopropane fatty-acyl-phospholipid synthase-like methyltransferase